MKEDKFKINKSTQNILLLPWALCQLFLFSYLKYHLVFLWLAQETPTQQKLCHLYSKMLKAVSQNPIKIQRKATRSTEELLRNSPGTLEIATSKYLILNSNKLNWQHGFQKEILQTKTELFFTLNMCVHRTVGREFVWHWWSWAGAAEQPAQQFLQGTLLPIPPPPVQPSPSQRHRVNTRIISSASMLFPSG